LSKTDLAKHLKVRPGSRLALHERDADRALGWRKEDAEQVLERNRQRLHELQYKLYADGRYAVLVVLQGIDASGKDGALRHVISAFNPQGCTVTAFKQPSALEQRHDYLWRVHANAPPRGTVGVFNRSHYESVLVERVDGIVPQKVWDKRYGEINDFERLLIANDVHIVKLFLHISKDEQLRRFEDRLHDAAKQWKFEPGDLTERKKWPHYRAAFEDMLARCSTPHAPWYCIPADRKWLRNLAVSQILREEMEGLPLRFPKPKYDPKKIRVR